MPFQIKPIEEIQQAIEKVEVQPIIDKVQKTELNDASSAFVFLAVIVLYLFRSFFVGLIAFVAKMAILALFAFLGYSLFLT